MASVYFSFRRGQYLSIASEHVTEIELCDVLNSLIPEYEYEFTSSSAQYLVFTDRKAYVLAVEVDNDKLNNKDRLVYIGKEMCTKFDKKLAESNEDYKLCRDKKKISSPILLWLNYNTLTTGLRELRTDPKQTDSKECKIQMSNQLKSQSIIKSGNKKIIAFVKSNALFKTD